MTVSVAIPTYNAEAYLELAVRSVLDQTLGDLEIIIVDDASTDGSVALSRSLAATDSRIRVEVLSQNGGPAVARNRALELAKGRWFAVLDSDDVFHQDRLKHLIAVGEEQGADMVADNLIVFASDDFADAAFFLAPERCTGWVPLEAYLRRTVMYSSEPNLGYLKPMMRVERLKRAGVMYNPQLRIAEDDDLMVRLLAAGANYWLDPRPSYAYRLHAASTSHRLSAKNAEKIAKAGRQALLRCATLSVPVQAAIASRLAAFDNAASFARLIEALKARKWHRAACELAGNPKIALLLRMPLRAALRRCLRLPTAARFRDRQVEAAAALVQLLANRGHVA